MFYVRNVAATLLVLVAAAGCALSSPKGPAAPGPLQVVASINAWGSVLAQLGGDRVHETSIITNPDTDPHDYEPTPADARTISSAALAVENGIGYDPWASKTLAANPTPNRVVLDVGRLVGVPDGGNPHRWYDPADVLAVAGAITADLDRLDPADAGYFNARHAWFVGTALAPYEALISSIKAAFHGVPVGASESIFAPLAQALGLDLLTPPTFLRAISEGSEPSAADKEAIDAQIAGRRIRVYVFNSQNSTPDVAAQVSAARARGIPVVAVTETLSPASATFQAWQVAQLTRLQAALREATRQTG